MARTIRTVGIVGSGIMGSGLAEVVARAGYDVIVASRSQASADRCLRTIDAGLSKAVERGKATADDARNGDAPGSRRRGIRTRWVIAIW